MNFMDTFKVHYYSDESGQAWVRVNRREVEVTLFKHFDTELSALAVKHPRVRFTDNTGGELEFPHIMALTPQDAIAEAIKVMVDRAAAQIDPYPFEHMHEDERDACYHVVVGRRDDR